MVDAFVHVPCALCQESSIGSPSYFLMTGALSLSQELMDTSRLYGH